MPQIFLIRASEGDLQSSHNYYAYVVLALNQFSAKTFVSEFEVNGKRVDPNWLERASCEKLGEAGGALYEVPCGVVGTSLSR